jgi:hypothetical protein
VAEGLKLQISDLKDLGNHVVEFVIRNRYNKDITAFAATVGDNRAVHEDYIYAEPESGQRIAPGGTETLAYAVYPIAGEEPQMVFCSVVFGDGTCKGNRRQFMDILDKRLGVQVQLKRFEPSWRRLAKLKDSSVRRELAFLRTVAEALPTDLEPGSPMSSGFESGLRSGRDRILRFLSKMESIVQSNWTDVFYQNGERHEVERKGIQSFREHTLPRTQVYFSGLTARLSESGRRIQLGK